MSGGCDVGTPAPPHPGAEPRVLRTAVDSDSGLAAGVARDLPITFDVDRLLAPRTVGRNSAALTSGSLSISTRVRYDPARRRVTFFPEPGQMRAELQYIFEIRAGLVAWDGAYSTAPIVRAFTTSSEIAMPEPRATTPTLTRDVAPILARRCATEGCHRDGARAVMALDLSSPQAITNTTVAVLARQRSGGGATAPDRTDPDWGALYRVDPGTPGDGLPAYSYLFYKIAGDGPIAGDRMPPPPAAPLAADEITLISDWIARGAPAD